MVHPGCMSEDEFKIDAGVNSPYVLMISGAAMDGVVGDHPQRYHNMLTKNGCDHVWQEVPQGAETAAYLTEANAHPQRLVLVAEMEKAQLEPSFEPVQGQTAEE